MRRVWKRILALVCAVTMVLGSGLAESAQMVNASDETTAAEYNYNIFPLRKAQTSHRVETYTSR